MSRTAVGLLYTVLNSIKHQSTRKGGFLLLCRSKFTNILTKNQLGYIIYVYIFSLRKDEVMKRFVTILMTAILVLSVCPTVFAADFFTDKEPVTDYAYSFVFVGDTQKVNYYNPENFTKIYDWIADNIEEKNIKHVFGLGDITEKNTTEEWVRFQENIAKIDGLVPYSLVRGNHDGATGMIYYAPESYVSSLDGTFEGNVLNCWQEFTVGDIKYLSLCLDYGPSDEVLEWANEVVASHPNHNVIVTTHSYLEADGSIGDENGSHPASKDNGGNDGIDIWNDFARYHPNILMIVSGHISSATIVETTATGVYGNTVSQFLIDSQNNDAGYQGSGGVGAVAIFYMSEDGRTVDIEYYSTIQEAFYIEENQYRTTLDTMDPNVHVVDVEAEEAVINVAPGSDFDITYTVTRNQGWGAMKLEASYNSEVLLFKGSDTGTAKKGYTWTVGSDYEDYLGTITPNVSNLGGTAEDAIFLVEADDVSTDLMQKGEFITFHLEVPEDAAIGEYTFEINVNDASSTESGIPCEVTFEPVKIKVGHVDDRLDVLGAQIRLPSEDNSNIPQGLRFVSSIEREIMDLLPEESYPKASTDTGIGFGTVVFPTVILGDGTLTKDTAVNYNGRDFAAKVVPAVRLYSENSKAVTFTAVMTDISELNYRTDYTVVPYITYLNDDGEEITLYGEAYDTNVFEIAVAAYNDTETTEYVKEYLVEEILSKVDPVTYPADGGWSDIYRP